MATSRTMPTVRKTSLPDTSLAAHTFPHIDYADAYRVRIPDGYPHDVESVARAFSTVRIGWILAMLKLRNRLVSIFGLKVDIPTAPQELSFAPGTQASIFKVYQHTDREILLGQDDSHLDLRVSITVQQRRSGYWAVIATVVRYNNWFGRLYFIPVKPFHQLIVKSMARNMFRPHIK